MIRSLSTRFAFLNVLFLANLPLPASAQIGLRPRPSVEECAGWEQELAAGIAISAEAAIQALASGWLAACDDGAAALGDAIRASAAEQDTAFLFALALEAAGIRDERVLNVALEVAAERSASRPARAAAILVLVAQAGGTWDFTAVTRSALLTEPLPRERICGSVLYGHTFTTDNGLPSDYRRRIAVVLDAIARQGGHPLLPNLARCSRPVVGRGIPPQVDVSRVTLRNVCETTFLVHNRTPEFLIFSYGMVGSTDHRDLPVDARKRREFITTQEGTVQLSYDGRVIQTASSTDRPCR